MPLALSEGQIGQLQTLREQYDHVCECVCVCRLNIDKNEKKMCASFNRTSIPLSTLFQSQTHVHITILIQSDTQT